MNHTKSKTFLIFILCIFVSGILSRISFASERRELRIALYPYIPLKAEMYWKLEQEFESKFKEIDLVFLDLSWYYYNSEKDGSLFGVLKEGLADVVEVDTVFLQDLVDANLLKEIQDEYLQKNEYLEVAHKSSILGGQVYGIPHWVCGNFIFFRKDDPERARFESIDSLSDLQKIIGSPVDKSQSILIDLRGKSTLGEKYLDSLLDTYQTADATLKRIDSDNLDPIVINSLNRLFSLSPGGLSDSDIHHEYGQLYAKEFARRNARVLVGYSERMHFVVDECIHGIPEGCPTTSSYVKEKGEFTFGIGDVDVVPAALSPKGSKMLAWVDVLSIRNDCDETTTNDALSFIEFFSSVEFTSSVLKPEWGVAPRYLLPAKIKVYDNLSEDIPLYRRFKEIMQDAISLTGANLNAKLRSIGKKIESAGFTP